MRKMYFLLTAMLLAAASHSQNITVAGALTGNGSYPDLGSAFTAINGGAQTGATITVSVTGNTTEAVSAVLNAGTWNSLTISPSGGASRTITGNIVGHLVDLSGADNVTINGLNTGGNSLSISNTGLGAASTIRFINDATNNTVTNCTLSGSTTSFGVVFFSTGTATGNDGNNINNNTITAAGANFPTAGVYSLGSSAVIDNSGNTISANNIADIFSATAVFTGMNINSFNNAWTITNNKIYQTTSRAVTTANTSSGIFISSGNGHTITGNVIGFASAAGTGTMSYTSTVALRYIGINCAFATGAPASSIQNNTIASINFTTSSGAATTNGVLCGINVTAGNADIGTVTGNTIGASSGTASLVITPSTTQGSIVGINCSSTGTIVIQNNTIGAFLSSSATATVAGGVFGINVSGVAASITITNNTIGNATANNMVAGVSGTTTGSSIAAGINQTSIPAISVYSNNTIQNFASYGTGTGGYVRGIQTGATSSSTAVCTMNGNVINNLTTSSALTGISSGLCTALGIQFLTGVNSTISNNTISNISATNAGAVNTIVAGFTHGSSTSTSVFGNKIYGLSNASTATSTTAPGIVAGIVIRSGTTDIKIFNNMISLGNGMTTNTAIVGIWGNHGSTPDPVDRIYFNSVNIEGVAASGAQPSFCFYRGDFSATARTQTVDIKNNIFTNTRSGGTGKHYAISNNYGATTSATGWTANASNNNVLNATAATVGYWTTDQTFAGWKTASASDVASFSGVSVPYVAAATGDLHLNFGVTPTQIESGGTAISGITTDYDGQTRPGPAGSVNGGGVAPDMGADEFDGVFLDLTPPAISYTPLSNTLCVGSVNLTATITDAGNVNTAAGTKPRIWFKKSTNANVLPGTNDNSTDGWKYAEATNASSPFTFTINPALLFGGLAGGETVQYFVVAQDLATTPNVGINNGTFSATPASVALSSPAGVFPIGGTINSYTVGAGGLSGTVTIGAAGTYTSITGAGGLFAAINASGLTGNLTANILDASVTESGATALNQMAYGCGGPYTLTIKPGSGVTSTLTGSLASGALFKILSSNVTIDGSNNGTTSRDLTITNTNITGPTVLLFGSIGTVPVNNCTLKNATIINGINTASALAVTDGTTLGNAGYFNNITIQNNSIQKAYIGLYCNAVVAAGNGSVAITGNDVSTSGANAIRICGLYVQGTDGAVISGNTVGNFETASAENDVAIWMATGAGNTTVSGNTVTNLSYTGTGAQAPYGIRESSGLTASGNNITGNTVTNISSAGSTTVYGIDNGGGGTIIQKNNVSGVINTNTGTYGAYGINVTAGNNVIIRNNFVSNVNHDMTGGVAFSTTFGVFGIRLGAGTGHKVYHNSVNMYGLMPGTATTSLLSGAFCIVGTGSTGCDVRNNIFANNITGGTTSIAHVSVALPSGGTSGMNLTMNNNAYYYGTDVATQGVGQAGTTAGTGFYTTLAAMAAYTNTLGVASNDNASKAFTSAVGFISATDLHLNNAANANWCLNGAGVPVGVLDDIDGQSRSTNPPPTGPDLGADEFIATSSAAATPSSQTICSGGAITTIVLSGATTYSWTRDNAGTVTGIAASGTTDISGSLTNTTNAPITVTFTITPFDAVGCPGPAITATVLVNPTNTITLTSGAGTTAQTVCVNTPITAITYSTTGATGATFSGLPAGVTGNWAANVVTISGSPSTTVGSPFNYTVTLTGGCGVVTATGTITVTPNNTITLTSGVGTNAQTVCINTPITNITYSTTGATGATFSGLPTGVTGNWAANVVTISGSPSTTVGSPFSYTVTLTGGCGVVTATGTITVTPNNTITLTSGAGTIAQSVCLNSPIANITYSTTGATGATFSGLPTGVTGNWAANVVTISGSPSTTVGSPFNYTVTLTGGCGVVTATGTITVKPLPVLSGTQVEPTTCASTDGSINLTVSGAAPGPYTYNWSTSGGSGLINGVEDQTGLTVGSYTVIVTSSNGCSATTTFNLVGPGGCSICPTIPTVTTSPSGGACAGTNVTFTASGLTSMGSTYGIIFKYSASALADPYTGGTVIATVPNGSLTSGGTVATANSAAIPPGTYNIYAILTPTPIDIACRPSATVGLVIGAIPDVNQPADQVVCNNSSTAPVNFSGSLPGTVYTWTNNTAAIGLAATGSGDITSFTATNPGTTPLTATITVTPMLSGPPPPVSISLPGQTSTFPGNVRGYVFTAPVDFNMTSLFVPTDASSGSQSIAVVKFNGNVPPPFFSSTTNAFTTLFLTQNNPATGNIPVSIHITAGEVIGILGYRGAINSYTSTPINITIAGNPVSIARLGMQLPLTTNVPQNLFQEPDPAFVSRVLFEYTTGPSCTGSSKTFTITVNPTPAITCPANITVGNAANQCGNIVTYTPTITGTPAPTVTYSFSGATTGSGSGTGSGSFFNVGTTTVTITITNTCGTTNCSFTVTVNDTQNPSITCPAPVTVSCASAVPVPNIAGVTASDNCPGVVVTWQGDVISAQTCANRYTITRTYRATDAVGNFIECTQTITVNDVTAPTLTCPAPVTVSCASAVPAPNIASVTGVSDNCGGVVTVTWQGDVISAQTCANRYTITRTYRATDVCGNFAQCTQTITVNDVTPPTLTCPAPVTVSCASAVPAPNIASVTGVSDNCGGVVTVTFVSDVISAQTCANRYTITRTYRATDVCGNFAQCTQTITVNDVTPPTLTCPAPVTVSCASAVPAPNVAAVTGVSDNCGGTVTVTHQGDVISGQTCPNRYTITRTYRATDVCGNFAECTQIITVNDQTAPVLTCPANITVTTPVGSCTAVVNFTPTATDNCNGAVTIISTPASGTAFPLGTTTVNVTATDACGNSSSCSFTVTVNDAQLPVITAQPQNRTVCVGSNTTFNVTAVTSPNANGPLNYQWQSWNGSAWVNITGATASSLALTNVTLAMNTNSYRVVITGLCTTIISNFATLYVNSLPNVSIITSIPPQILPTQTVTLTASVAPGGGTYQWFKNNVAIAGATGNALANLTVNDAGTYKVVYTDPNGCVNTSANVVVSALQSNLLFIYPNPNDGRFHVRFYNNPNEQVTVTIFAANGALAFRKVLVGSLPYTDFEIDLGGRAAAGIYIVEVRGEGGRLIGAKQVRIHVPE